AVLIRYLPSFPTRRSSDLVADEAAGEREEALVEVGASFVADEQPFELVEPGEGAFDYPAPVAKAGAVAAATACDRGLDAALAERSEEHTSELQSLAYLVCR